MSTAHYDLTGAIAVIRLDNPPVNGLGLAVRQGIVNGILQAEADDAVKAVVLIGSDRAFSGGADISEFGTGKATAEPNLNTVINYVESSRKPVIAAISGACMGGGLELALGCNYRIAKPDAQIALPEVKLGLLPGAGGTQRLPRVIGAEHALNMIVSGSAVPAKQFKGSALFDEIVDGDLLDAAIAYATKVANENLPLKKVRDLKAKHPNPEGFFMFTRNTVGAMTKNYPAPLKCVDAVKAAVTMPFDKGMQVEREAFVNLMQTPESRALRHAFFSERLTSKVADVPSDTPVRDIKSVGVIGGGTMGTGISINFLNAGIPVTIVEMKQEGLDRGVAAIQKVYEGRVKKGRMSEDDAKAKMALLSPSLSYDDLGNADLVIEAVFEEMGVKQSVFEKLDEVCKQGAILASNTSTLDLNKIASFTKRPEDVIGLHFFSPANIMKLLEVVRGDKTAKDVLATAMKLAKTIKKTAVVSGVCDGFIGNRMINQYQREALLMLEEGASVQQIDKAIEKFGFAMGPLRMADLAGGDIGWAIRKRQYEENPDMVKMVVADRLCEMGRYGQKTGAGFYRYEPGNRNALHDPEVDKVVDEVRAELGITPRKISNQEIVERCVYALVNEGAQILDEGIAQRASDIDMVYLTGYGFPVFRGGPMHYAEEVGLPNVVRAMQAFTEDRHTQPGFWEPAALLARRAEEGKGFDAK
ncbi:3-hydroxyacyl-CoA dehydrogenase NAD-binding domain-containing protein [Marinobacter sp. SS13-12]|uniref:3-hydroxyacyl-CoA dehydrogenase NAD-binding domain-containing protein n=1 Tax=Marinobacter sp. SS13-12 TaxID=3050451 RepID=UPI002556A52D|nr:3-hydroxyacyl-CoA dehydrogenase NAD-binding domain-containing protein [Marinobacter sp. SS13-12]MDK8462566.1 3-hydroxyacyl-CoA dehydrogenase NAD-binding domain-containing protein [Marinobacter sp. SS13-12]